VVDQTSKKLIAYAIGEETQELFANNVATPQTPVIELDTWHLIGLSVSVRVLRDTHAYYATIFVDDLQERSFAYSLKAFDLSAAKVLRVGGATDAFAGDVTALRFMTPGAPYLPESNPFLTSQSYIRYSCLFGF